VLGQPLDLERSEDPHRPIGGWKRDGGLFGRLQAGCGSCDGETITTRPSRKA